jgi:hypothetical protein
VATTPPLRAKNATTAMPLATVPKINCRTLKPRNGIWKSNSVANSALATRTATGAQGERRHASHAAKPEGSATVRNYIRPEASSSPALKD